jgi:hypothetical protein
MEIGKNKMTRFFMNVWNARVGSHHWKKEVELHRRRGRADGSVGVCMEHAREGREGYFKAFELKMARVSLSIPLNGIN